MNIAALLDFIAQHESCGDFNIVWAGIKKMHRPKKPLVEMSIGEVLAWQDSIDSLYRSEAAGRYQILEDTLRGLYVEAGLRQTDLFNRENQNRLGRQLLVRRGLVSYLGGQITAEKFANAIAREWASMPVVSGPQKGRSYYAGDGLNKSGVSVDAFMAAVKAVKEFAPRANHTGVQTFKPSLTPTPPKRGWLAIIIAAIVALFRSKK